MKRERDQTDVVIAGAGPVGLAAAIELGRKKWSIIAEKQRSVAAGLSRLARRLRPVIPSGLSTPMAHDLSQAFRKKFTRITSIRLSRSRPATLST
jgi:thioredoxin reductase